MRLATLPDRLSEITPSLLDIADISSTDVAEKRVLVVPSGSTVENARREGSFMDDIDQSTTVEHDLYSHYSGFSGTSIVASQYEHMLVSLGGLVRLTQNVAELHGQLRREDSLRLKGGIIAIAHFATHIHPEGQTREGYQSLTGTRYRSLEELKAHVAKHAASYKILTPLYRQRLKPERSIGQRLSGLARGEWLWWDEEWDVLDPKV